MEKEKDNELMQRDVSVRDFIKEYLIDGIEEIKKEHPYHAFLLMAVGVEFLGKCKNTNDWNFYQNGQPEADFNDGLAEFPKDLEGKNKYDSLNLYKNLRCGLAHSFLMKGDLTLSDKEGGGSISCDVFYDDFVKACKKILTMPSISNGKSLDDTFFSITTTEKGASTTGNTKSSKCIKHTNG